MKNYNLFLEQQAAFKTGELEGEAAEQFALQSLRKALIYATNPDEEEDMAYEAFKQQKAEQTHQLKVAARRRRMYVWTGIAASFLLIVGFWQLKTPAQTPEKLWLPLTLDNVKMGTTPTPEDKLKQAKTLYKQEKYAEALPIFKAFVEQNDVKEALPYILLAECYGQETPPDYTNAIAHLEKAQHIDPPLSAKRCRMAFGFSLLLQWTKGQSQSRFPTNSGKI